MIRTFYTLLFLMFSIAGTTQVADWDAATNLPSIIPPSPDVASISKVGSLSTGLHTGSANVTIPLYTLKVGSLTLPLALNYSTNGTKVSEIPSRVGLGWNLVAGGVISRIVHDEEDGGPSTQKLAPPDFYTKDQALLNYLNMATWENYDTEQDEYTFSVNGMSGKFYIEPDSTIRIASHSNIKIEKQSNGFILTTAEGVKYYFGDLYIEKTTDSKVNGIDRANLTKTTGWFLTQIVSPEGDYISFNYDPLTINTIQGSYQSVVLQRKQPVYTPDPNNNCSYCLGQSSFSPGYNRLSYQSYSLSGITASNGLGVQFIHTARPENDQSGDHRVSEMQVYFAYKYTPSHYIQKYRFEYEDFPVPNLGIINQRFYLKKLYTLPINGSEEQSLVHQFEYYDPANVPHQKSRAQDYFGYANGGKDADQPQFFPRIDNYEEYHYASMGADRNPNFSYARNGALRKVTYPTGGSEEFVYESHEILQYRTDSVFTATAFLQGEGQNVYDAKTYTRNITVTSAPVRIQYTTDWNAAGPAPGSVNYHEPDDIHFISYLEIWNLATNQRVFEARHTNYTGSNLFPHLSPNGEYQIRLIVRGNSHHAYINVSYNPAVQEIPYNAGGCGIRVKKINAFDLVSGKVNTKYYTYAALQDLSKSSGVGALRTTNTSSYLGGGVCVIQNSNLPREVIEVCSNLLQVSSSSLSGGFSFNGSPIAYKHVIESDDPQFVNGGVEHTFHTVYSPYVVNPIIGDLTTDAPDVRPDQNGLELKTRFFKKEYDEYVFLKEVENVYGFDPNVGYVSPNYIVRKRWEAPQSPTFPMSDKLAGYDVGAYQLFSGWSRLEKTITTDYDQNGANPLKQEVAYSYNNSEHLQPTEITTTDSKGKIIRQVMKYPSDYSNMISMAMINNRVLTPVVEQIAYNGSAIIAHTKTEYDLWPGIGKVFRPRLVQAVKGAGALEDRLHYFSYTNRGNPQEVSKDKDIHQSYLWSYNNSFPLAEVKNASVSDIAYTSFEINDFGSWSLNGTLFVPGSITGVYCFTGSVSKSVDASKVYIVTLWTKGSATVNGLAGTLQKVVGVWHLYEWRIAGSAAIDVNGQFLDELRLYPEGAQMTTYTYQFFIGVSSSCDINNNITYYEYDGFNRLSLIRDENGNVLKKYCYNYQGQVEDCGVVDMTPKWVRTGVTECVPCAANSVFKSGEQRHQEVDTNPYSPTYNQSNWISDGANSGCASLPDWQRTDSLKCEIEHYDSNGNPIYTGNQLRQERDMNPCSTTPAAERTRWVSNGQNCTTCPKPQVWVAIGDPICVKVNGQNTSERIHQEQNVAPCSKGYQDFRWVSDGQNCTVCPTAANWQPTGVVQCEKDDVLDKFGNPVNTGIQIRQERDMNSCSVTFNQTQWVSNGQKCDSCAKPQNWQLESVGACEVNSAGQYTGYQYITERNLEMCSPQGGQTRTRSRYNPSACPLPYVCSTSNCSGNDKKCINNVCETGSWAVVSVVRVKIDYVFKWKCTRRYCFSDGTFSDYYQESLQDNSCSVMACIM